MKVKITTTKHNTTPEEQWNKFLGELVEFQEAREEWVINSAQVADEVVKEGLDCIKSARKYSDLVCCKQGKDRGYLYDIVFSCISTSDLFDLVEEKLYQFQNNNTSYIRVDDFIKCTLNYLYSFCQANDLNFEQILKEHDERLEKRGVKMKVYIDEGDIRMLKSLAEHVVNFEQSSFNSLIGEDYRDRLKRMIDEVEK